LDLNHYKENMIYQILEIIGSLGLFLYGMRVMSDGIQKAAGERLHSIMNFMTGNRFSALLTGVAITALIQSSSATTVMVVSFVNAGLLNLGQAIGVIMGANIGTTVTGWIVALIGFKFKISAIALPAIGIGLPLIFIKKLGKQEWGETVTGFGILFLGLNFLKNSVPDIQSNPEILEFLTMFTDSGFWSFLIFVGVGTVLTFVVQSSSAAMAITLTMAHAGWIDYPTAAAIVLGENIGTTLTAYLASVGTNVNAKRASRAHTLFNIAGVFWMAFLFVPFLKLVDFVLPGDSSQDPATHLAMFHTLFNLANSLIFIWFIPQMTTIVKKLVKSDKEELPVKYELKYISTVIQDTPELNLLKAKHELFNMAGIVHKMFTIFREVFDNPQTKMITEVTELKEMEDYTDQMQEQISAYISDCTKEHLNERSAVNANAMIRIVNELESIGDSCFNLIILAQRRYDKKLQIDERALKDFAPYSDHVFSFIEFIKKHLNEHLPEEELNNAIKLEDEINGMRNVLKKSSQTRLQEGGNVKGELLYIDLIRHVERIGDYSINVAQALRQIR